MKNKLKNIDLKKEFQQMTDTQLSDWKCLSNFIFNKAGIKLNVKKLKITEDKKMDCWGGVLCLQYPDEIGKLLSILYKYRDHINSFCEIGTDRGGSFFIIDSFLRAINPNMGKSIAVDKSTTILRHSFEEYKEKNNQVNFINVNSKNFNPDQNYDFCFIDGEHEYPGCKRDFYKMIKYSNLIALHDIKFKDKIFPNGGVLHLWEEIDDFNKIELLNEDSHFPVPLGIGVVINDRRM